MFSLIYVLLAAISLFARFIRAGTAFAGCFEYQTSYSYVDTGEDGDQPPVTYTSGYQPPGTFDSGDDCGDLCSQNTTGLIIYSSWQASTGNCYCLETVPAPVSLRGGRPNDCADAAQYDNRHVSTTFIYRGMYSSVIPAPAFFGVGSTTQCFQACAGEFTAVYRALDGAGWQCSCLAVESYGAASQGGSSEPPEFGGYNALYVFDHPPYAQMSQLSRRSRRERLEVNRQKALNAVCPFPKTACLIPGAGPTAFECLDISSELEACGGCLHGTFNSPNATIGEDCTSIGAAIGASTCDNGQCLITACQPDYVFQGGRCVAI